LEGHIMELEGSQNNQSPGILTTKDGKKKDEVIKLLEVNLKEAEKRLAKLQNVLNIFEKNE